MKYPVLNKLLNNEWMPQDIKVELRALFAANKEMREKLDHVNTQIFALATVVNEVPARRMVCQNTGYASMEEAFPSLPKILNKQELRVGAVYFNLLSGEPVKLYSITGVENMVIVKWLKGGLGDLDIHNLRYATTEEVNNYLNAARERKLQIKGNPQNGRIYATLNGYCVRMIRANKARLGENTDQVEDTYGNRFYIYRRHLQLATDEEVKKFLKEVHKD